jgi:hypothetical protein
MIINLRGTNGSGKSTIVKQVMGHFAVEKFHRDSRRQPIGYKCYPYDHRNPYLWVVGHYETDCGGCDTITSLDDVYGEVRHAAQKGYHVLYEGIMASGEYRRCVQLYNDGFKNLLVLALEVPLTECITAIQERRASRSPKFKPFNPSRTARREKEVHSMMRYLKNSGVPTQWVSRDVALATCFSLFGVQV